MSILDLLSEEALAELIAHVAQEVTRQAPIQEASQWLTVPEAAARLRVDHKTLRKAIKEKRVPALRVGTAIRVREADLIECFAYEDPGAGVRARPGRRPTKPRGSFSAMARNDA